MSSPLLLSQGQFVCPEWLRIHLRIATWVKGMRHYTHHKKQSHKYDYGNTFLHNLGEAKNFSSLMLPTTLVVGSTGYWTFLEWSHFTTRRNILKTMDTPPFLPLVTAVLHWSAPLGLPAGPDRTLGSTPLNLSPDNAVPQDQLPQISSHEINSH